MSRSPIESSPASLASFLKCLVYGRDDSNLELAVQNIESSAQGAANVLAVIALPQNFLAEVKMAVWSLSFVLAVLVSRR